MTTRLLRNNKASMKCHTRRHLLLTLILTEISDKKVFEAFRTSNTKRQ